MKYLIYIISFSTLVSCVETKYYKNGNLKWQLTDTTDKYWYKNGQLKDEYNYNQEGKSDGIDKHWYKNGQLWYEESFKNGKRDGLFRDWYKNGQLAVEKNYKDGKRLSKKRWDEEGKPIN
jgi:antitoxin component YwqK of YwqJK toxin-antitoxin module